MSVENDLQQLLDAAKNGDQSALGHLLDAYRSKLRHQAKNEIDPALAARMDASDVVQQTCLSAIGRFDDFEGADVAQFAGWLRQIHTRNMQDVVRRNKNAAKRDLAREQRLDGNAPLATLPADPRQETPSQQAMQDEATSAIAELLSRLPSDQREVVRLRYIEGWAFKQIASHFDRSEDAIAGLLKRGLRNLRKGYDASDQSKSR